MSENEPTDRNGLAVLDRQECLRLLRQAGVGRVGLTVGALPAILPVNFTLLSDGVVFRTSWGGKLRAAADGQVVCFEADDFDSVTCTGWSVLVTGRAEVLLDPVKIAEANALGLAPWAPLDLDSFVLIRAELITGRRIVPATRDVRAGRAAGSR